MAFKFALRILCISSISSMASANIYTTEVIKKNSLKFLARPLLSHGKEAQFLTFATPEVTTIDFCKTFGGTKCKEEIVDIAGHKYRFLEKIKTPGEEILEAFFTVVVSFALSGAVAYFYMSKKEWPITTDPNALTVAEDGSQEWSSGTFDCSQDWYICLLATCCMPVRWADTMSMMGFFPFWTAWFLLWLLETMEYLPYCGFVWFGTLLLLTTYRQRFRELMQIPGSVANDLLLMCCCLPCTIAQEARHVEAAARYGHPAVMAQRPLKDSMTPQEKNMEKVDAGDANDVTQDLDKDKEPADTES